MELAGSGGVTYPVIPGQIDEAAKLAFLHGQCHALALALHEATGWVIWGSEDELFDVIHVAVRSPEGLFLDISGLHEKAAYLELEQNELVMDQDFLVPLHPAEVRSFGDEESWRTPDLETARSFVEPLLEQVGHLEAKLPKGQVPDPGPLPYEGAPVGSERHVFYL